MGNKEITTKSYDATAEEYIDKVKDLHPAKFSWKFMKLLPRGGSVLDLGCGGYRDSRIFADEGFEVTGIDISENLIELAKQEESRARFEVMDIRELKFQDGSFNGVWANAIFVHVAKKDINKSLLETYRVLKENGILYISVKQGSGEGVESDKRYGGVEKFWSYFKEDEIVLVLKDVGFSVVDCCVEVVYHPMVTHPWIRIICKKLC